MAGTYYKYAEREADSYVNWGEIGKNLTDMLQEQNKIREDKRAAIDAASREFGETLANAPQGEQKQLNQWALEYASDAQEARLLQDRLLKSGRLSVRDYTVMRQNINDGTKQAFNLVKEYQEEYKTKMERVKQDKNQDLEVWIMQQAEGFGNFAKSKLYINPTNFQVSVAGTKKQIVNGKEVVVMETDPNKFTTVNALRNRMKGTYDKYDLPGNVKGMVDNLGVEINSVQKLASLYQTGTITETLDITKRTNLPVDAQGVIMKFEEAETKMLQAQLQNPYNTSSILTNTIGMAPNGKQYTYTFSKEERDKNPNLILLKDSDTGNPVPEFTPEQEKAALERLRLEARMQYDKKVEIKTTPQIQLQERRAKTEGEMAREDMEQEAENFGRNLALLTTGNAAQKAQAARYFASVKGISGIEPTATGINIYEGATGLPFDFTIGGKESTPEELGRAIVKKLNKEGLSEDIIIKAMKKNFLGNTITKDKIGRIGGIATDYSSEVGTLASTEVPKLVVEDNPTVTAKNLKAKFESLGFNFSGGTRGITRDDYITVSAPNGKSKEFNIDDLSKTTEIANFIRDNRDDKKAEAIFGSKVSGSGSGGNIQTRVSGY
jgi:hypothetical protein